MTSMPARLALAAVGGLLAALAFEPFAWAYLLPVAVAAFTLACRSVGPRQGFWAGLVFGVVFMLVLLPWMRVIGTDAWVLLSLLQALLYGVGGLATALVMRLRWWPLWAATVWVGVEMLRGTVPFGGFPWGRLAFATVDTPVAPAFAYVGAAGVTFLVALVGTASAWGVLRLRGAPWDAVAAVVAACALAALASVTPVNPQQPGAGNDSVRVAAVQGNVPGEGMDAFAERRAVLDNHVAATREYAAEVDATSRPDFVIWPENSTDIDPFSDPTVYDDIQGAVDAVGVPVLVGALVGQGPDAVENQGIVWHPASGPGERYTKRHPVPFGEYIPFRDELEPYIHRLEMIPRDMVPGRRPGILDIGGSRIGDVICFEVAYDGVVRDAVRDDTRALVVQTNNATYMGTGQVDQQFAIARLRAIETGRPVVVAATNGVSGIIAPDGRVRARAPVRSQTVLVEDLAAPGPRPVGLLLGWWVELGLVTVSVITALLGLGLGYRRRSRREAPPAPEVSAASAEREA